MTFPTSLRSVSRRALIERAAYAFAAVSAGKLVAACADDTAVAGESAALGARPRGDGGAPPSMQLPPLQIAMLLYPGFTLLDLAGPQTLLGPHSQTYMVSKNFLPVTTDMGVTVLPNATYETCPGQLDAIFVPGGPGTADAMLDERTLQFLRARASDARYVTSICTGALILAAAGLLDGYRAGTHWAFRELLAMFDVEVVHDRVVIDRNRMTGGGVTAGIDFGLTLLTHLRDEQTARLTQLMTEYTPQPPYDSGSPETAGAALVAQMRAMTADGYEATKAAAEAVLSRP